MSEEKTLITHATSGAARYLGYDIRIACDNNQMTKQDKQHTRHRSRAINMLPVLAVPQEIAQHWQRKHTRAGKPMHRPELLQSSDSEIVMAYGLEFQGVVNYYSMAYNVAKSFYPVKYVFMESAVRTLAHKHSTRKSRIYAKYKRTSPHGVKALIVETPNPRNPEKPYQAKLGDKPIRTSLSAAAPDEKQRLHVGRTEIVTRLLANTCELCGSKIDIEVHHVHKLADVKKRFRGTRAKPDWAKFMMARNRKSVVVCHSCHRSIHHGEYDGRKVNSE